MKTFAIVVASMLAILPAMAQSHGPMDIMIKHWQTSRDFTLAVADAMPADSYSFKPNPEEMSFGEVMEQVARANGNYFSHLTGVKNPISKPANFDKDTVMKELADSFDFCTKTLQGLTPDQLHAMSGPEGHQMSGLEWILAGFIHTAHHRGQAEVYLRVKNIKPPAYKF